MTSFPVWRARRLRRTGTLRALIRETRLTPDRLVLPLFVVEPEGVREPVGSMPGVHRTSAEGAVEDAAAFLPAFAVESGFLWLYPGESDYDGFFAARLVRRAREGDP